MIEPPETEATRVSRGSQPASAEARFTQCNRMIDLIIRALAPVMPEQVIAGSSASISFAAYSGVRPSGDYWVFLEVNEGAYGGRPRSDGPDSIDNLMANTRNNPLEDLAMHLPMICDRYELRDDLPPGLRAFLVEKRQAILRRDRRREQHEQRGKSQPPLHFIFSSFATISGTWHRSSAGQSARLKSERSPVRRRSVPP